MDNKKRITIQGVATLLQNANIKGFFTGKIYQGQTKNVCVPGLNCYSCPGAIGACPIGSLQNTLSSYKFKFPYYVLGLIFFFGALFGRMICGFICPFGFVQDILYKIPFPKKIKTFKGDKLLRNLKYIVLVVMVIILPIFFKLTPVFCKYLCPSGTLAGIFLLLSNTKLFSVLGGRFAWKVSILVIVILISIIVSRPFCKYLCPLGAMYAPFNKISVVQMTCDNEKCIACKACQKVCDMCVDPSTMPNSNECIRCGKCISTCPTKALKMGNVFTNNKI
ncbi:MAG: 4Fe-4S binding protein [Lachnospiraceae bacterium]|nr:4Fe-4S binding protein [Lachnospiraceae bacterium]